MAELSSWKVGDEIQFKYTNKKHHSVTCTYYKNMYYILKELQWFMT